MAGCDKWAYLVNMDLPQVDTNSEFKNANPNTVMGSRVFDHLGFQQWRLE
jgi:hypothetical protein